MEKEIKNLLDEYQSLAGKPDAASESRKNEIIAALEGMDRKEVSKVVDPFVEENAARLEGEVKALRDQIELEDYKLLPISYIAKNYFDKSASWLLQRINGYKVRGKVYSLNEEQKGVFNQAVREISSRISALQLS